MSLRLFMDEDSLHGDALAALRSAGFDCLTATSAGRTEYSDADQLEFAAAQGRVVFTHNTKDFVRLHDIWASAGRVHGGIIVLTSPGLPAGGVQRAMVALAKVWTADSIRGSLLFLRNFP